MTTTAPDLATAVELARAGQDVMVRCPAHDDGQASLHVSPGTDQPVVLQCHAGCETEAILYEAGMTWEEVSRPVEAPSHAAPASIAPVVYSYTDEDGAELFQALRFAKPGGGKEFRQRHKEAGQWVWNLRDVRRVLYRLPAVIEAVRDGRVITITEGEKDVLTAVERYGLDATTNPMGAGKWRPEYTEVLAGSRVNIVSDADKPGREHARAVAELLRAAECTVRIFESPFEGCKDLTDHWRAGHSLADLIETTVDTTGKAAASYGMDIIDYLTTEFGEEQFVIEQTLAREERLLVVGLEGHGKSTLLRQIAACTAAGIHPFTMQPMKPRKVLYVDAENSPRQMFRSWENIVGLCARHGHPIPAGQLTLLAEYLTQPNLTKLEGRDWFFERIAAYRPDLILVGPVKNVVSRNVTDDEVVRKFKETIDESRTICSSAVVMEHHAPHKAPGEKIREVRPYGSSLFLSWVDYGYGMQPTEQRDVYEWRRNRNPRERSRVWPEFLRLGKPGTLEFPWEQDYPTDGSRAVR